jgi:hypothetical protein
MIVLGRAALILRFICIPAWALRTPAVAGAGADFTCVSYFRLQLALHLAPHLRFVESEGGLLVER